MSLPIVFQRLSERDRRALALGAVTVVCVLSGTRAWPAYSRWSDRVEAEAAMLVRLRVDAAQQARPSAVDAAFDDSARARASRLDMYRAGIVPGPTPAAAAAELGSELRDLAEDAGLEVGPVMVGVDSLVSVVRSTDASSAGLGRVVLPGGLEVAAARATPTVISPYVLVRANVDGIGPLGAVTAFLDDVEAGTRRLRVREVSVDPAATSGVGGPASGLPGVPLLPGTAPGMAAPPPTRRLHVRLVVEGLADRAPQSHARQVGGRP